MSKYITKDGQIFEVICEENSCRLVQITLSIKKLWLKTTSNALGYDWIHSASLSKTKIEPNTDTLENFLVFTDIIEMDCNLPNINCFYIVYHLRDTYSDSQEIFTNFEEANKKFLEYCQQQEIGIENENIVRAIKKSYDKTQSTLYNVEKDVITYNSRWILEKITL